MRYPRRPEEGIKFLGVRVPGGCDFPSVGAGNNIGVLRAVSALDL